MGRALAITLWMETGTALPRSRGGFHENDQLDGFLGCRSGAGPGRT